MNICQKGREEKDFRNNNRILMKRLSTSRKSIFGVDSGLAIWGLRDEEENP